jgi:hypothetical protein
MIIQDYLIIMYTFLHLLPQILSLLIPFKAHVFEGASFASSYSEPMLHNKPSFSALHHGYLFGMVGQVHGPDL